MTDLERKALLPAGLRDVLPPDAAFEAAIVERLIRLFQSYGYDRVRTPLIEFEDSLLSGAGVAVAPQTFRLMDPVSQRMMGVRADITPQIARLARTRLSGAARPLRLSYAGEVLRVRGSQLRPERQVLQVGAELIGSAAPAADAEIVAMAAAALEAIGVADLSVDLTVPRLVPSVLDAHGLEANAPLRAALDRKDPDGVAAHGAAAAATLVALLRATGTIGPALAALAAAELPPVAAEERDRVAEVAALVAAAAPAVRLTLDPVEHRGFEYHTGIGFTVFAAGLSGELAAGGRYRVLGGNGDGDGEEGERATGVTLYVDSILATLTADAAPRRILVPGDTAPEQVRALRETGWTAIGALAPAGGAREEAQRLGCTHILGPDGPEDA